MKQLLFFGLVCVVAPCILSRLHFVFGGLTRSLVCLLALGQILIVPVLVALEPDISFGSDGYSLGGGVSIMLITAIEFVFVLGTAVGLWAGISSINRRERAADTARAVAIFSVAPPKILSAAPAATPELDASADALPAPIESTELPPFDTALPAATKTQVGAERQSYKQRPSIGLSLMGAYLCFIIAASGANILVEGLTSGSYGWIRNVGAVTLADRPVAFAAVTIMFLTPTFAASWGIISLLSRIWRRPRRSTPEGRSSLRQ